MTENERENIVHLAEDLQDLMNLLSVLEGVAERLRKEVNEEVKKIKEEDHGDGVGFKSEDTD